MQTESLTLKSTPAAKVFMRLIAALNSGNVDKISDFVMDNYDQTILDEFTPDAVVNWYLDLYETSGGINIHKVYMSQQHYLIVIVQNKTNGRTYIDKLKITDAAPYRVLEYLHEPAP